MSANGPTEEFFPYKGWKILTKRAWDITKGRWVVHVEAHRPFGGLDAIPGSPFEFDLEVEAVAGGCAAGRHYIDGQSGEV